MSAVANCRIDPELKRQAEAVLDEIGLKPRAALELFYKQIVKRRAIPFPVQADSPEDEVLSPEPGAINWLINFRLWELSHKPAKFGSLTWAWSANPLRARVGGSNRCTTGLASVVLITRQFEDTPYEVTLPRVPWLREQSLINVQSIQPVKFTEFLRRKTWV